MLSQLKDKLASVPLLKELAYNNVFLTVAQIYGMGAAAIVNILLIRQLGPTKSGIFISTQALILLVFSLAQLGVHVTAMREGARRKSSVTDYFSSALTIRLFLTWPATVLLVLLVGSILDVGTRGLLILMATYSCLTGIATLPLQAFQSLDRFDTHAKLTVITKTISLVAVVTVLFRTTDLILILATMCAAQVVIIYINWRTLSRYGYPLRLNWNLALGRLIIIDALPVVLAGSAEYINLRADSLFVAKMVSNEAAGLYGASYSVYTTVALLLYVFSSSMFPTLARMSEYKQAADFSKLIHRIKAASFAYGMLGAVALYIVAPFAVPLLFKGDFQESIGYLQALVFALPFVALNRYMVQVLNASDLQMMTFRATAVGAVFNLACNYILIPRMGVQGAIIATIATEILVWVVAYAGFQARMRRPIKSFS